MVKTSSIYGRTRIQQRMAWQNWEGELKCWMGLPFPQCGCGERTKWGRNELLCMKHVFQRNWVVSDNKQKLHSQEQSHFHLPAPHIDAPSRREKSRNPPRWRKMLTLFCDEYWSLSFRCASRLLPSMDCAPLGSVLILSVILCVLDYSRHWAGPIAQSLGMLCIFKFLCFSWATSVYEAL